MINEIEDISKEYEKMENIEVAELLKDQNENIQEYKETYQKGTFIYSDAYIDDLGNYVPRQIKGIYRESIESGKNERILDYLEAWKHQENIMSCAAACSSMEIQVKLGKQISEKELCKSGEEGGWYDPILGTYSQEIGKFVDYEGLNSKHYSKELTLSDLNELNKNGVGLMVCVDNVILERPDLKKPCTMNHVVEIIGFDNSNPEHPLVIINDPGTMYGRGAAYEFEHFERAAGANTTGGKIKNVTTVY